MNVRFLEIARRELDDAFNWYELQTPGLGYQFLDEADKSIRRMACFPNSCVEIGNSLRRSLLSRFPYGLIYGIDGDDVVVVAVAHLHREPRYWIERFPAG
jgi:plasmid stabilization system protein ParE